MEEWEKDNIRRDSYNLLLHDNAMLEAILYSSKSLEVLCERILEHLKEEKVGE